jgi:signal transduction histidine kinase
MTTLVVLAFAIPLAVLIRSAVAQRADRAAIDQANNVALFVRNAGDNQAELTSYLAALPQNEDHRTSVRLPDGTVLGRLPPGENASPAPAEPPGHGPGPDDGGGSGPGSAPDAQLHEVQGGRVAQVAVPGHVVQVYVSDSARYHGEVGWWALLAAGSAGLLLLSVAGGEVLTRRIVRPLTRTAETARLIKSGDVTARAPEDGPREVAEVGLSLNQLADRIDELIAEERETVADLSHRMRTPLTALRLDADSLRDPVERDRIGGHVSSLERTLTAIIRAARRPQREGRMPSTDASSVVRDRVTFWSALTDEQERPRTVELPEDPVLVRASAEDLAAAVDALLENVVAHTVDGTAFRVSLGRDEVGARLVVADEGPGLPEGAAVRGRSDRGSTGLGLSIARGCAEASGGSMAVAVLPSGGTQVTLLFGSP